MTPKPFKRALDTSDMSPARSLIYSVALSGPLLERGVLVEISKSIANSSQGVPLEWAPVSPSGHRRTEVEPIPDHGIYK